jgi:hypothetical protein
MQMWDRIRTKGWETYCWTEQVRMTGSDCGLRMHEGSWRDDILPRRLWTLRLLERSLSSISLGQCARVFYTPRRFEIWQVIAEIDYPSDIKSVNDQGQLQRIQNSVLSEPYVGDGIGAALTKGMRPRCENLWRGVREELENSRNISKRACRPYSA